jgi:hypothetical protein
LAAPNTELMTWGNPRDEWGPKPWRDAWKLSFSRSAPPDMGSDTTRCARIVGR